ncbi:MAG: lytic transglycosylase domain-containing protein [Candidatus Eremiobacteraeota bacterium]|nr:lytic transglycosylase domain-containing protein [Candidatus Eremiobacteraeota bacterium]
MSRRRAPLLAGLCFALGMVFPVAAPAATHAVPANRVTINAYATVLREYNPQLPDWQSKDLARHLLVTAHRWKIDTNMLAAIVSVESSWHTHAMSYAGAIGLGQLMPGTAAVLGVNPRDPVQNLSGAARYLRGLLDRFHADPRRYELTFAAYNAGPQAVEEFGGIPPYGETQNYVVKVLRAWHHLQSAVRLPASAFTVAKENAIGASGPDINYWLGGDGTR